MNRFALWEELDAALRASFPDRADALLAATERWLDPGPWSVRVRGEPAPISRDRLLADVQRALAAHDADRAAEQVRELERWMLDGARAGARARLGLRWIVSLWAESAVDWAATALEAGLDSPALRILAGTRPEIMSDVEEWLFRSLKELGIARDESAELRDAARWIAREALQGRIEPFEAVRRERDLAESMPEGEGDRELWGRLYWEHDSRWNDFASGNYEREVAGALRALLGAEEAGP